MRIRMLRIIELRSISTWRVSFMEFQQATDGVHSQILIEHAKTAEAESRDFLMSNV